MLLALMLVGASQSASAQRFVNGYTRSNGTYVAPYWRTVSDSNPYNNWSFPGNINPYTGRVAAGNPSTYLYNYYNRYPQAQIYRPWVPSYPIYRPVIINTYPSAIYRPTYVRYRFRGW